MPRLDLTDAEQLKKVVVDPLIAMLRVEMRQSVRPLVEEMVVLRQGQSQQHQKIEEIERRLSAIERFKMRIVTVCSGIAVLAGIIWSAVLDWVRGHFFSKGH
jgi:hypothetical protein